MPSARRVLCAVLVLVASSLALAGPAPAAALPCEGFVDVPGQGPSCPVPGGWEVILDDGTRLLTHGPDPAREPAGIAGALLGIAPPAPLNRFLDLSPACDYGKSGVVALALPAPAPTQSSVTLGDVPAACGGLKYGLSSEEPLLADVDVCWLSGATVLRCDERAGHEVGTVPAGTTAARVTFVTASQAKYWLAIG